MILFVVVALMLGQQEPRLVFVSEVAGPSPYDWPENMQEADYNIGFYGTQCIASRFARRMARETLGLPNSTEYDAANRAALTALALESQTWGYMDVAFVTAARATELVEAMEYLIPYLEQGNNHRKTHAFSHCDRSKTTAN